MEESLEYLQFMENAEEEEAWLGEKCALVSRGDSGDTLAATQVKARQDGSTVSLLWFGSFFPNVAVFIHEIGSCILGSRDRDASVHFKCEKARPSHSTRSENRIPA